MSRNEDHYQSLSCGCAKSYIAHMGHRNTICTHQMLHLEAEPGYSQLHPDHYILQGHILDYASQNIHLALSASGNAAYLDCHQFLDHPNGSIYHGNQYSNTQNCHPVPNLDVGAVAWTNIYSHCTLPSSSSVRQNIGSANQPPPFINHQAIGINVDEYGRSNHFSQSVRGFYKRKNAEAIRGNFYRANASASSNLSSISLSQNSRQTHWEEPYGSGVNMLDSTTSNSSDYQFNRTLPSMEGSVRSVRNRSSSFSIQPEFAFEHHFNYLLPGNYMGQSYHPASNAWVAQAANNIPNGGSSNWNYTYTMPNLHGRSVSLGAVEMANMSDQGYQQISSSLCLASLPYFQQHPQPIQNMQIQSHSHHARILAPPYQHLLSNMHPSDPNSSSNYLLSGSRFLFFPSNAEQVYRPSRQLVQATPEVSHENVRILTSEDPGFVELSGVFGARNIVDENHDMRLDIDGMSYEELLALEEQIGDVNTGLTEEFILKNLKTIIHGPQTSSLPNQSHIFAPENEACIICQVEYDEKERIGILDCGHNYHADCIKQWLLVKNLCPICKASALTMERKDK
ncbi:probable E3 ubiquitin-protein ligase ZFP1 isoform X2 [Elaeis guineensis]|nr:probable E3 ubiquitin-protein ligase ZFP1 isoform X2 [Elaeis guineensis]XP_019709761.1 probable E3 ubiquitin-protein ligase ZFP1 isoform X2 [Elaeis guineensis]XP_019709762.1 probable E3 ubiquitin-protein ligase ZFP1 isoform X2 [Elaeis guineensis]